LGLSPGLDFETRLFAKTDAAALLEKELRMPKYACRPLTMGTNTDPYQPIEREHKITRSVLEVLARFRHPVSIVTKGALITRDIDILAEMAKENLAKVYVSVTTLDHRLSQKMEPRASAPKKRLGAIRELNNAGIPTGVMFAPAIPGLNDHEMDSILAAARDAGAEDAAYIVLRLPIEVKALFYEWLATAVPERASRVMTLIRSMRRRWDYDPDWNQRMIGTEPVAETLRNRFHLARKRLGFKAETQPLATSKFCPPLSAGGQLALF
jgi:DNA repair photolyase